MTQDSQAERALWKKLADERRRSERLESEVRSQVTLIMNLSAERNQLLREVKAMQPYLLWMANRINYLESRNES